MVHRNSSLGSIAMGNIWTALVAVGVHENNVRSMHKMNRLSICECSFYLCSDIFTQFVVPLYSIFSSFITLPFDITCLFVCLFELAIHMRVTFVLLTNIGKLSYLYSGDVCERNRIMKATHTHACAHTQNTEYTHFFTFQEIWKIE